MNEAPKRLHLDKDGLEAFFGELEAKIMRVLWDGGPSGIAEVKQALEKERDYSYNTVMTVLNRLVEKGCVRKTRKGKATSYAPARDRDSYMRAAAKAVLSTFFGRKAVFSAAQFAEAIGDLSESDARELRKLLK